MSAQTVFFLGAAIGIVALVSIFVSRLRTVRRRQNRLSGAFARAQQVRTRGGGLQGATYSIYAEPAYNVKSDHTHG